MIIRDLFVIFVRYLQVFTTKIKGKKVFRQLLGVLAMHQLLHLKLS